MEHSQRTKTGINLLLINAFIYTTLSLYTPYLSSYYSKAGIRAVQIGILLTVGPLVAIFVQPLWAVFSDRSGKRKMVLSLVILGSALSMLTFYLGNTFFTFLIASILLALFSTSIIPLSDAVSLRSAKENNLDFSKIRMGGTIGFATMVNFSGFVVKQDPAWQFVMGFLGYIVLLLFVLRLPTDDISAKLPVKIPHLPKVTFKERFNILNIFESKQIFFLLAFAFISQVGLSFNYTFLGVYMVKLGLNEGTIGFVNSIAAFSELPVLFLMNRILKKSSTMRIAIFACAVLVLRIFVITGENIIFVVISQILHGITFMTIYYSCAVFISNNVKPENQSKGQSILAIVQTGIGSIVGNIVGGSLVDIFGLKNAYRTMSALILTVSFAIVIVLALYKKSNRIKEEAQ